MSRGSVQRTYDEYKATFELAEGEDADNLYINLPGFKKEQIKVQIDTFGNLKISGERQVLGNRWARYRKDFRIPENCNVSDIRAKFENGLLNIVMPKLITQADETPQRQASPPKEKEKNESVDPGKITNGSMEKFLKEREKRAEPPIDAQTVKEKEKVIESTNAQKLKEILKTLAATDAQKLKEKEDAIKSTDAQKIKEKEKVITSVDAQTMKDTEKAIESTAAQQKVKEKEKAVAFADAQKIKEMEKETESIGPQKIKEKEKAKAIDEQKTKENEKVIESVETMTKKEKGRESVERTTQPMEDVLEEKERRSEPIEDRKMETWTEGLTPRESSMPNQLVVNVVVATLVVVAVGFYVTYSSRR